ncbi:hypothetical protein PSHT_01629 [Puccinia striiformis]|uniref:Uncharacterized protein n=1 Tax=Puccinia striiformis TaxID=27350 RepID=A0A2S4WK57_9BASI|nr:hypothetical protein PSHT_01629 [Puccinia striiformis]
MSYSTKRSTIPFANTTPPEQQQSHHHHQQRPSSDSSSSSQPSPTKKTKKKQSILRKLLSKTKNNNLIGKGIIRNVARTVKKSLHTFDRPRLATAEPQQRLPASQQDRQQEEVIQPPSPQSTRARAVTISEVSTPNKNKEHYTRSLNQPPYHQSFDPDQVIEGPSTPPRSPKRLKKKTRPQSAFIEHPSLITQAVENVVPAHYLWQPHFYLNLLLPPIEDSTFMAILPSQDKLNLPVPHHLSLIPPPSSLYVDPPTLTAIIIMIKTKPIITDSLFISTPSKFDSVPASPNPALGSSWMEIPAHPQHESYSEVQTSRPPIVTTATSISIVHSCVAERGSIADLDLHLHADDQVEELAGTEIHNELSSRKRKVTSFINDSNPTRKESSESEVEKDVESDRDCGSEERQHKVLRGLDQPFSSHPPPHHQTSEPISTILTTPLTTLIRPRKLSSNKKNRKLSSKKSPLSHHHEVHHHHVHHHTPSKNPRHSSSSSSSTEVWNFSVVSTVVGVVILAVVFIGSTNLSHLHTGKPSSSSSWIADQV